MINLQSHSWTEVFRLFFTIKEEEAHLTMPFYVTDLDNDNDSCKSYAANISPVYSTTCKLRRNYSFKNNCVRRKVWLFSLMKADDNTRDGVTMQSISVFELFLGNEFWNISWKASKYLPRIQTANVNVLCGNPRAFFINLFAWGSKSNHGKSLDNNLVQHD